MKPNDKAIEAALRATSDSCSAYQIQNALDAAFAAQFPPSEDYAELIETLRSSSPYTLSHVAADVLEALLAERKSLTAAVLLSERQNDILTGDIDRLRVERNANIREKGKEDE